MSDVELLLPLFFCKTPLRVRHPHGNMVVTIPAWQTGVMHALKAVHTDALPDFQIIQNALSS
jgi:hypothetical protein